MKDAAWISVSLAVARGIAFLTAILAARILTVEDLAGYLVAVAISVVLVPVADMGLWPVVTRTAARAAGRPMFELTREAVHVRALLWLGLLGLSLAVAFGVPGVGLAVALGVTVAAIAQVNLDSMCGEQFARHQFERGAALRVVPSVLLLVGTAALAVISPTLEAAIVVFAAARAVPVLIVFLWSRPPKGLAREISIRAGLPFAGSAIVMTAYTRSDLILLNVFGQPALVVAQYGIVYNVVMALQMIPSAIGTALYPRVAAGAHDPAAKREMALGAALTGTLAAGAVAAVFLCFPDVVVSVFGGDYSAQIESVSPLLMAIIPMTFSQVLVVTLQGMDRESTVFRLVLLVGMVNVGGNLALIPVMGVDGALLATLTAETLLAVCTLALALQRVPSSAEAIVVALALGAPALGVAGVNPAVVFLVVLLCIVLAYVRDVFRVRSLAVRRS